MRSRNDVKSHHELFSDERLPRNDFALLRAFHDRPFGVMGPCVIALEAVGDRWSATIYEVGAREKSPALRIFASLEACRAVVRAAPVLAPGAGNSWELSSEEPSRAHPERLRKGNHVSGRYPLVADLGFASGDAGNSNA